MRKAENKEDRSQRFNHSEALTLEREEKTQHREREGQSAEMTDESNAERKTETKGVTGSDACARKEKAPNSVGA